MQTKVHIAGGAAGLTLTEADTVILMEPSLSPTLEAQAAGRVHRLGDPLLSCTNLAGLAALKSGPSMPSHWR